MKNLFLLLSVFLLFTGCIKNQNRPKDQEAKAEITKKVNALYTLDRSNDRYAPPKDLFSTELEKLLNECTKITIADTEKIKKSDHPTDMPRMLVSYLMTNLQDTATEFKIKKINVNGSAAEVFTEFYYENDPKLTQHVKITLINKDGWKIENVIYNKDSNLKSALESFIKYSKESN